MVNELQNMDAKYGCKRVVSGLGDRWSLNAGQNNYFRLRSEGGLLTQVASKYRWPLGPRDNPQS